jgi:integrase
MPKLRLTTKAIDKLRADPSGRATLYWDTELKGFGVLISAKTGTKSYIVQRDLRGGRTRRVTVGRTNVLSLEKARDRAQAILAEFYSGRDPKQLGGRVTLRTTFHDYLKARNTLRSTTKGEYRRAVEKHLEAWLDRPLREITPELIEAKHRVIAGETGEPTANSTMRVFRLLWNFQADRTELPANPVKRLKRQWFQVERRTRHVAAEHLGSFYAAVSALPNPIHRDYLLLLLYTGLRRREAASLDWESIDLRERIIRLGASRTKAGRKLDLPMSREVHAIFLERQRLGREKFVFPSDSRSGHIEEPKFPLRQVARASGVAVSVHDLRRTFITIAESADISPIALKGLVNHSLGNDVTSGYVQISVNRLREASQKVADRITALCGALVEGENVQTFPLAPAKVIG